MFVLKLSGIQMIFMYTGELGYLETRTNVVFKNISQGFKLSSKFKFHDVSIHRKFYQSQLINDYATKNSATRAFRIIIYFMTKIMSL